jgi:N-acetylglutamate synthase-like GNAT family acetyltransferase
MVTEITIRSASEDDLDAINRVITRAVMTWDLPERVKRLSLPSYHYDKLDLQHFQILLACMDDSLAGVIALDQEQDGENIPGNSLLIHGLFVDPELRHKGIGTHLFQQAEQMAQQLSVDGLLVRAHKDATGFFSAMGMSKLAVSNEEREYAGRYWKRMR